MRKLDEADYVVVGSGSAGAALAYRLSENGRYDVLVIEAGGTDAGPFIQMPGALSFPMSMKRYDWGYRAEPETTLGDRRLATPRGKVIGGSSSINGMVYVRGHAKDFDYWAEAGARGWGYGDVLPYFKRMEAMEDGDPIWRGLDGPLHMKRGAMLNPLYKAFIEAGRQAGFPVTDDYNGEQQEGFGPMQHDDLARPPLVDGERLSQAGHAPRQLPADERRGAERRLRGHQGGGRARPARAAPARPRPGPQGSRSSPPARSTRRCCFCVRASARRRS